MLTPLGARDESGALFAFTASAVESRLGPGVRRGQSRPLVAGGYFIGAPIAW
jgi:hypothetical protein